MVRLPAPIEVASLVELAAAMASVIRNQKKPKTA